MHSYRLTNRGKFVLFALFTIIISTTSLKGITLAKDNKNISTSSLNQNNINGVFEIQSLENEFKKIKAYSEYEKDLFLEESNKNQEEFLSVNIEDVYTFNKKVAFLTFDDGPSHNVTPLILKTLDDYNIKATFFVLGKMVEKNSDILKDIYDNGHAIGIHTYSHDINNILKSKDNLFYEIKITQDVIKENLGKDFNTRLFRFPGGSFEANKQQYINDLYEAGYINVDWNALTADAEYKNPVPEKLLETLINTTSDKDQVIILMHDSITKEATAEILPEIIEYLKAKGYKFATLK